MRHGYLGQDPRPVLETDSFRDEGRATSIIPLDGLWATVSHAIKHQGAEQVITLSKV